MVVVVIMIVTDGCGCNDDSDRRRDGGTTGGVGKKAYTYEKSGSSSGKRKREEDNTNDFDVSLCARRLKTTDAFFDLKGVLQDISSFAEDYFCKPRFDDRGFKFVESIFPQPTGVVTFDAVDVSRIGGQKLSPSVRIGGHS